MIRPLSKNRLAGIVAVQLVVVTYDQELRLSGHGQAEQWPATSADILACSPMIVFLLGSDTLRGYSASLTCLITRCIPRPDRHEVLLRLRLKLPHSRAALFQIQERKWSVCKTKKTLTLGGRCSLRESPAAAGGERCVDLFVVQQEIDELRDLNVVNCDLGPVLGGDDQVQLPGAPLYLYTPRRFRRFGRQRRPEHADAIAKCAWSRRTLRVPGPCRASRSVTVCRFLDPAHRPCRYMPVGAESKPHGGQLNAGVAINAAELQRLRRATRQASPSTIIMSQHH